MKDRYGLEVTTGSQEALDAYVEGIDRMLAADARVEECLDAAVAADPDLALAHVAIGRQHQLYGRGKEARAAVETAGELAGRATTREQQHVEIITQVVSGQIPAALDLTREHLQQFPRDAFVLAPSTGVFGSIGFSGRVGREPEQLELVETLAADYGDDWWFLTVHAFALLEMGRWTEARTLTERALELRPDNAHAAHTLAHALYEAGEDEEATSFLAGWLPSFDPGSLMHCHNWWHYAILLMGAGRTDEAWQAYSQNCAPGHSGSPSINVFTDSASFLWRAELAGNDRDEASWESVRQYYEAQFRRPIVFVDAHAGLPYAALGKTEELQAVIAQLQELGEGGRLPAETLAATIARAFAAYVADDWATVIDTLEPIMDQVVRIGGSRAQRDLVTNTLLSAYVQADRPEAAAAFLAAVDDRQPSRPVAGLG